MIQNPVFIIGTERSGSNLMRFLLNAHPNIAIPHPPHIMRDFSSFLEVYDDLSEDKNFAALAADVAGTVNRHFAPWTFTVSAQDILNRAPKRSLYGLYTALYELYLEHSGKQRWGCKSTFMHRHIDEILAIHPQACFVHLVRDPRDVAVSAKTSIFCKYTPYKTAQLWADEQAHIEHWKKMIPQQILSVRYEDLTAHPERVLRQVMEFISEPFVAEQLEAFRGEAALSLSALSASWKNCKAPISQKSVGQFEAALSGKEVEHVEWRARHLMIDYGYTPISNAHQDVGVFARGWIEVVEWQQMFKAESAALLNDKNFYLRWRKKMFIQYTKQKRQILGA